MLRRLAGASISAAQILTSIPVFHQTEQRIHRYVRATQAAIQKRRKQNPQKETHRSSYLEWNYEAEIFAFNKRLSENFDELLLKRAFVQKSYVIEEEVRQKEIGMENTDILEDNSKLIEIGESFMHEYISSYLEVALPNFPREGIIALKDYLMTDDILAYISSHIGTKDLIFTKEFPVSTETFTDVFKALVGALIESTDLERAAHFVRDLVITRLYGLDVNDIWEIKDAKGMLAQHLEKSGKVPEYRLIKQIGKNSLLACSRVGVYIDKEMFCSGYGENIDIAVDMAAREGLKIFFGTQEHMPPIDFKIPGIPNNLRLSSRKEITA